MILLASIAERASGVVTERATNGFSPHVVAVFVAQVLIHLIELTAMTLMVDLENNLHAKSLSLKTSDRRSIGCGPPS
jgi:hypothetical protein